MATPTTSSSRAPETGEPAIDVSVSGFKWQLGEDRTIDWSVSSGTLGEAWPNEAAMVAAVRQALSAIAAVADVRFNYLGTFAGPAAAAAAGSEINVAPIRNRAELPDHVLGISYYPRAADGTKAGDLLVNLNSIAGDYPSFAPGTAGFLLLLHELGHTLGLKHPFESDGAGRLTLEDSRFAARDVDWFSMMSYNDPYQSNREKFEPSTPMPLDVAGLQHLYGPNRTTGAGDTIHTLVADETYRSIWDAGGVDTVSVAGSDAGWEINLAWDKLSALDPAWTGLALPMSDRRFPSPHSLYWLVGRFEAVTGSPFFDKITGSVGADRIQGGGGGDLIDGFQGRDVAVYEGLSSDFSWRRDPDGSWAVIDLRPDRPEGVDILTRIEVLSFADREVELVPRLSLGLETAFRNLLRSDGYSPANEALAAETVQLPLAAAVARLAQAADATASVVTLGYQFFTGRLPSEAQFEDLVSTTSPNTRGLNGAYYQGLSLENRYIGFAVGLGKADAGKEAFAADYGSKTLIETVKSAYLTIFGGPASDATAAAILTAERAAYFAAWGGDGPNGLGTKAAAVGFLLAEAAKADVGVMQTANLRFLADLADGAAFSVDLVGAYGGEPYLG